MSPATTDAAGPAVSASRWAAPLDGWACDACLAEVIDPFSRRYRYPFGSCGRCQIEGDGGPPESGRGAGLRCGDCEAEHRDPASRRHRHPGAACHACGPRARLVRLDGRAVSFEQHSMLDDLDAAGSLIAKGEIVALPAASGVALLACDATRGEVVARLRAWLGEPLRPVPLVARDLGVLRRYARLGPLEQAALRDPRAPFAVLETQGREPLPRAVTVGLPTAPFALPATPLQLLALRRAARPVVMVRATLAAPGGGLGPEQAGGALAAIAAYAIRVAPPLALSRRAAGGR